jgi:hypothetical protein
MNQREKLEQLNIEAARIQKTMDNCKHDFASPIYDAETVREGYGIRLVAHGSDAYPEYTGYHDVQKDRWSRECKICGKKEYTYKQEAIIKGYEPKF